MMKMRMMRVRVKMMVKRGTKILKIMRDIEEAKKTKEGEGRGRGHDRGQDRGVERENVIEIIIIVEGRGRGQDRGQETDVTVGEIEEVIKVIIKTENETANIETNDIIIDVTEIQTVTVTENAEVAVKKAAEEMKCPSRKLTN